MLENPLSEVENNIYVNKFKNEWVNEKSGTADENFDRNVQLSQASQKQLGWLSRDNKHINVSLAGKITHW